MKYPEPLQAGSKIAITAFSAGVSEPLKARLAVVVDDLHTQGFKTELGDCLFGGSKHVSAPKENRAKELMRFLMDDSIDAIAPPWGGELAMELLPMLDWKMLEQAKPKWVFGFSDVSTLTAVLTARLGWASAHTSNLMDLTLGQRDPLTANTLHYLGTATGGFFEQHCSEQHTQEWPEIDINPKAVLQPNRESEWKWFLNKPKDGKLQGRLIGGCWDTLFHLFQTEYLNLENVRGDANDPILLFLENSEMNPTDLVRALLNMKFRGVFNLIDGLLLGRNMAPEPKYEHALTYLEALASVMSEESIPVVIDMDIGHAPPNMTLINGAKAELNLTKNSAILTQRLV